MVVPLGGMGMQEEAGAPPCVKDRFSKWWWCLMGLLIVVMIGRFVAVDIFGGLLSGIMAVIVWYMVTNDCAKMSQYCVLLFGFLCLMNTILEFVTLASCLAGRQTSSTTSVPSTDGLSTSYTVTIEKHPFFDGSAGWYYNVQSAVMIACPVAAFCGAALAYLSYNAFPTSLFADEGPDGGEAQNFGGGRLGGGRPGGYGGGGYGGGGYGGGDAGGGGGGRAVQSGRPQASANLWSGGW